jgi:thiamine biosynthesis lipoprotein
MRPDIHKYSFTAMASECEILLGGLAEEEAKVLAQSAQDEVKRIEHKYSRYREDSLLSEINNRSREAPVNCDQETLNLLQKADLLYRTSGGLFDATSGVLRQVWDFKKAELPNPEALEQLLSLIDWSAVVCDGNTVSLSREGMELDFGGFGKEYAADCAAQVLSNGGASSGYVNLAGDFRVVGPKPNGQPWSMGIRDPRDPDKIFASIPVNGGALVTSGDYERYIEIGDKRYCHILNPRTGYPVNYWQSVSVLAPTALMAGSFSTICMLQEEQGREFLERSKFPFLAINHEGQIIQRSAPDTTNR